MLFSTEIGLLWMTVDVMGHDQTESFFNSVYGIAVVNWLVRRRITAGMRCGRQWGWG